MINFISRLFTLLTLACTVIFFIISCSNEDSLVNKDKLEVLIIVQILLGKEKLQMY